MYYREPESSTLEFKESLPKNNQIVKTIVGFCNQNGGKIIIGVKDNGFIVGMSDEEAQNVMEYLDKLIFEATAPPIIPRIYTQLIGDKTILIIEVSPGMNRPYYVREGTHAKDVYVRLGRSTLLAKPDMIEELKWQSRGLTYDSMALYHYKESDLDERAIKSFFKERKGSKKLPDDLKTAMVAYNILAHEHGHYYPTVAGMLMFGKDPNQALSEAFIICTTFAGISGRDVSATRDCEGRLTQQYREAYHFIVSQLNRSFVIRGPQRDEQLEIPEEAIREALLNALVHRNYYIPAPIRISIFDNRVEIFSPGNFPGPLNATNLRMGFTFIRNPALSRFLREMGYIEKLGSGLNTIFGSYEKRGLKEPEVFENDGFVKCVLPRPVPGKMPIHSEADEVKTILALFEKATDLSIAEIVTLTKIPRSTAGRKIAMLVKDGVLKQIGTGRNTRYSMVV